MQELIEEFVNYISIERGLAKNTLLAYRRDLQKYLEYIEKGGTSHIQQVSRDRVTAYMYDQKQKGLSTTSICRSLAAIKMFHRFLVRERLAKEDPTNLVDTPKLWKRVPEVLSTGEIEAMIKALPRSAAAVTLEPASLFFLYKSSWRFIRRLPKKH